MARQGRFITFEGGEGVGKSTNIEAAAAWLKEKGIHVVVTREPGGTPIAEKIRNDLLKAHHEEPMSDMAELLLMFAARAQHVDAVIRPALERGDWVLCDRFTDSTVAYQGFARGLPIDQIETLKVLAQGNIEPDVTLLLDAPLDVGMGRARTRAEALSEETDRFESEKLDFFEKVRQGFLTLATRESRFRVIDAARPLSSVTRDVLSVIQNEYNIQRDDSAGEMA